MWAKPKEEMDSQTSFCADIQDLCRGFSQMFATFAWTNEVIILA